MKKVLVAIIALLIIAAVAFGVRTLGARDQTDKVDAKDAAKLVTEERDDEAEDDAPIDVGDRPEPGTYTYTGSGREHISALGGSEHVFPEEIAIVVTLDAENDCQWTSNIVYVKQHIEERRYCTEGGNVTDLGFTREIEFFNQRQETTFECEGDALRRKADSSEGDTWSWTCTQGDKASSTYTATHLGTEAMTIGGQQVEATHTRVVSKQTGDTRGGDTSEFWLDERGLLLKFTADLDVQTKSILGDTTFTEQLEYELSSLMPSA